MSLRTRAPSAAPGELTGLVAAAANRFATASLELSRGRDLLRRVDTKFVADARQVLGLIEPMLPHYEALPVPSGNVAHYRSLYFDTPDRVCFHDHRRGRRIRHKIRIRHYPDRELSFLEVKTKRNELVTDKGRMPLRYGEEQLGPAELAFLRTRMTLPVDALQPIMRIDFQRVSLVGLADNERVTIDLGLMAHELGGARWGFDELVVIEVKQAPYSSRTPVMRAIQDAGLRERSMSKYTVATAMLNPALPRNRLLADLRAIERR